MRIGVIGAGAVGGAIAARLASRGHAVRVTARGEHLAAIRASGIHLRGAWGDETVALEANELLEPGVELAIVATKAHDAARAIQSNAVALEGVPVLVIQNGLAAIDSARALLPRNELFGGLAMFASSYLAAGSITVTAPGPTFVGGSNERLGRELCTALAPIDARFEPNLEGAQWSKLVVNQINALPAITGLSAQEVIAHDGLRRIMVASMRETVRVGRARGIRFASVSGLSHGLLRAFEFAPFGLAQTLPKQMAKRMGDTPNPGSTLQSIKRGQLTEIDFLNGAVVAEAALAGGFAPINAALQSLVHEVETSGHFLTAADVTRRLARAIS